MINITVDPQPIKIQLDMKNVERFDENKQLVQCFLETTKIVKEDVDGVEFETVKPYDRKIILNYSGVDKTLFTEAFKTMVQDANATVTVTGTVDSSTDATLIASVDNFVLEATVTNELA